MKEELDLYAIKSDTMTTLLSTDGISNMIVKLGNLKEITITEDENVNGASFISGTEKFIVGMEQNLDIDAEIAEKEKELEYQKGFVRSINKKLSNERFVNNAPEAVVANERKKMADGEARIKILKEEIDRLKGMK